MRTAKLLVNAEMDSLVLEVYLGRKLIYSHDYMQLGCTDSYYHELIDQAITDLNSDLSSVESWDGCDLFEGKPVEFFDFKHTFTAAFTTEDNEVVVCPFDDFKSHTHKDLILHFFPALKEVQNG